MKKKISLESAVFGDRRLDLASRIMSAIDSRGGISPGEVQRLDKAWSSGTMVMLLDIEKSLTETRPPPMLAGVIGETSKQTTV